jgi:hypothetical protein
MPKAKRKRTPLNRIPASQEDVKRARRDAVRFGILISLWAVKEYCSTSDELLEQMAKGVAETCEHIAAGRISYKDIESELENSYDLTMEVRA